MKGGGRGGGGERSHKHDVAISDESESIHAPVSAHAFNYLLCTRKIQFDLTLSLPLSISLSLSPDTPFTHSHPPCPPSSPMQHHASVSHLVLHQLGSLSELQRAASLRGTSAAGVQESILD